VPALRRALRLPWLRLAGSAAGVLLLLRTADLGGAAAELRAASPAWLLAGLALTVLSFASGVVQWGVLLRRAPLPVRWRSVALWQAQSVFACHVLPSAAAGDAVRAVNACRAAGTGTGIGSILGSRLAGGLSMAVWGLGGAVLLRRTFGAPLLAAASAYVAGIGIAWILVLTARPAASGRATRRHPLLARGARVVGSLRDGCHAIRDRTGAIAACLLIAVVGWGLQLLALGALARAVGVDVPLTLFAVALPMSLVATWAPASVNGVGLREGVMAGILVHAGVTAGHAGAVSLVIDLQMVPVALGGALVWMGARRPGQPAAAARTVSSRGV
jgi:glycosyltransferase 2 family protein